jgi:protein SCO1
MVSIHPKETAELARAKERKLVEVYERPGSENGWHLLTGSEESIQRLTQSVGFRYTYDPQKDLVNHPAGLMILTPDGKVSRYFYGADFPTAPLREALLEAAQEKIGPKAEVVLFGCVMIDPITGKRTLVVKNVLILGGVLTVLGMGTWIGLMSIKSRRSGGPAVAA